MKREKIVTLKKYEDPGRKIGRTAEQSIFAGEKIERLLCQGELLLLHFYTCYTDLRPPVERLRGVANPYYTSTLCNN